MTQWLPIESAPKDGTPLLLFAKCKGATAASIVIGWFIDGFDWIELAFFDNKPIGIIPTHWQPLPDFPKETPND